ncbi:hypothetical protein [Actinokineospora sp. NBRC 105648]|uniref:hypothetical protein n=1 Tax=Actinokineospora sp. NBRC 105648 TaxID=3032206 RepID=UPI0024A25CFD|nr:hypothetical protein [Actinokineospora sp. NBRC 105648]GLZ42377.1 hypothetical protein Acsp05_60010 [Actinokineospora sp. NBRC 105648]
MKPVTRLAHMLVGGLGAVPLTASPAAAGAPTATNPTVTNPTVANPAAAAQLRIAIDNGRTSATVGDTLVYAVTVHNLGTTDLTALRVTQSAPTGLTFGSADSAGAAEAGGVAWDIDLKAGAEAVLHSTMTVAGTPPELLRLATVACAARSADDPPIVCAAHSDQLPAGAAAAVGAAPPAANHLVGWYGAGGAVLLGCVLAAVLLVRRRHRTPSTA